MNKVTEVAMFAAGAAIGALVTWKLVKNKYERIAQEEINSVKETFAKRKPVTNVDVPKEEAQSDFENSYRGNKVGESTCCNN